MPPVSITKEEALVATGCRKLADALAARSPFASEDSLVECAQTIWWGGDNRGVVVDADGIKGERGLSNVVIGVPEWLEAIARHARIGSDSDLERVFEREKREAGGNPDGTPPPPPPAPFSPTASSASEKAGAGLSSFETRAELARWNDLYEQKFGHRFMLCAFGKTGEEILEELKRRFFNPPYAELAIAANEKIKIVEKRLRGLCAGASSNEEAGAATAAATATPAATPATTTPATPATTTDPPPPRRPPITTHVLDVALGRPASGVRVVLLSRPPGSPAECRAWVPAEGANRGSFSEEGGGTLAGRPETDADGRCSSLLSPGAPRPPPGDYRIEFDVGSYFEETRRKKGAEGYGGGGVLAAGGGGGGGGGRRGGGSNSGAFYPSAAVEFVVSPIDKQSSSSSDDENSSGIVSRPDHLHIPLTFSPFGYSTYRGS